MLLEILATPFGYWHAELANSFCSAIEDEDDDKMKDDPIF